MSLELRAFLFETSIPSLKEWQNSINKLGFDFKLDPELKPFKDSGFSPGKINGQDSGFEIYYETSEEVLEDYPHIKNMLEKRDYCISFRFSGDMDELACALIASAALAKFFGALVFFANEDTLYQTEDLIKQAQKALRFM